MTIIGKQIAVGVLSAFAAVWSCVETWSWHRRSGMVGLDPILIVKLVAIAAGNLANVFFCVIFFTCLYWFGFYKEQNFLHAMLPSEDQEKIIKDYVISIFSLKVSPYHLLIMPAICLEFRLFVIILGLDSAGSPLSLPTGLTKTTLIHFPLKSI